MSGAFTIDVLRKAINDLHRSMPKNPPLPLDMGGAGRLLGLTGGLGVRIVQTEGAATDREPVTWIEFPRPSRHRSKRVMKKLLKRYSTRGLTKGDPCILMTETGLMLVHPTLMPALRRATIMRQEPNPASNFNSLLRQGAFGVF